MEKTCPYGYAMILLMFINCHSFFSLL